MKMLRSEMRRPRSAGAQYHNTTLARCAPAPRQVVGAIAGEVRRGERVELQAIGANAVHNAVKAIIAANRFLEADGNELTCALRYAEVEGDRPLTAVVFARTRVLRPAPARSWDKVRETFCEIARDAGADRRGDIAVRGDAHVRTNRSASRSARRAAGGGPTERREPGRQAAARTHLAERAPDGLGWAVSLYIADGTYGGEIGIMDVPPDDPNHQPPGENDRI